jgi:hypothetical protein
MNRTVKIVLMGGLAIVPAAVTRAPADIGRLTADHEQNESADKQKLEETKARDKYEKAVAKHGKDSQQARKAWQHYEKVRTEHGHATSGIQGL